MAISLRLDGDLEHALEKHAKMMGRSKSELIRGLIDDFLKNKTTRPSPWEIGKDVFGRHGSGKGNLSFNRKSILKEKLHAKKNRY